MSLTEDFDDRPVRAFTLLRRVAMPRRLALVIASVLAITPAVVRASADTAPADPLTPRLGCTHAINDAPGDAKPDYTGAGNSPLTTNDGLDIEMVSARVTDTQLQVFLAIKRIPLPSGMAASESTYRYKISFAYGGKGFTYGIEQKNPTWAGAYPTDSTSYPMMNMGLGAANDLASVSTGVIRQGASPDPSWIIFTSPRDKVEQILGAPIPDGAALATVAVTTQVFTSPETAVHSTNDGLDTTLTPAQDSLVVGGDIGDWCYGPPPTSLGSVSVAPADVTDSSTMSAILLDENGKALAGKRLTFAVNDGTGKTVAVTTDANGKATAVYGPIKARAGTYPVTVSFAGETALKASTATGTLTVSAESCLFKPLKVTKPSAKTRVVTATLVDDGNHAIAGVPVTWWVNGRKVATAKTASNGTVVLKSAKPGQTVQAKFAGVAGMFLAANSKAVKV
jgi:hypothetical protein